jgi:hypothetical protein
MERWLLIKLTRGDTIVIYGHRGPLAALHAEFTACPFGTALRFRSTYKQTVFRLAIRAATTRPSRGAAKVVSHYMYNGAHIERHQRFIGDAYAVARECGFPGRAHAPRDLLHHVIYAVKALAPPSLRPLQRADFVFGAHMVQAAAPQVPIAPGHAPASADTPASADMDADTVVDSEDSSTEPE